MLIQIDWKGTREKRSENLYLIKALIHDLYMLKSFFTSCMPYSKFVDHLWIKCYGYTLCKHSGILWLLN